MTERRVNLRLAAVGGDKLKADLVSIGKEGRQALQVIEAGGPGASAGLNMTGQAAADLMGRLESLAVRAARAAAKMNEMASSGGSVMARINASTGVSSGVTRDAEDIAAYGRSLDDLRAKFNPLFAEQRRHAESVEEINRAYRTGAITLDEWVSATRREEAANAQAANSIRQRQAAFENFVNTGLRDKINELVGVTGALARTEADIEAYGRALDDARAKFNPLFAEERRHAESLAEIEHAYKSGAISMQEWEAATRREIAANEQAANSIRQRQAAFDNFVNTGLRDKINEIVGVTGALARSEADIEAYGRALDDARAKFNPLFAEQRRHRDTLAEIEQALRSGAIAEDEFVAATNREKAAHASAAAAIRARAAAMDNLVNTGLRDKIDSVTGVSGGLARGGDDVAAYGRALDETRAKYNPMFAAISRYRSELAEVRQAHAVGAISADEMTAAISRLRQASLQEIAVIKGRVQGYQAMEKQGGLARFQMVQLGYQLNDIGVSLASGQNPFVVMVQQGAQIAQIYGGQGGVRAMFSQIGGLISALPGPLKAVGVAAAIGAVGIAGLTHEINKASAVQVTFGDTAKAVWEVFADGVFNIAAPALQALAPIASAVWDTIVQGTALAINVIVGYWRTLGEIIRTVFAAFVPELTAIWTNIVSGAQWVVDTISGLFGWVAGSVGGDAATLAGWFTSAWEIIASGASDVGNAIINGFKIAFDAIGTLFSTLPSMVGAAVVAAANAVLAAIEALVVKATSTIQSLLDSVASAISMVPGMEGFSFGKIGAPPALGRIENTFANDAAAAWKGFADRSAATWKKDNFAGFGERVGDIWDDDPAGDLFDSIKGEAEQNAKERLEAEKGKGKGGGRKAGGGAASQEKSEVDELIKSLEREMTVLKETDPIKKQMLEYSKQLAGATEAQKQQVLALVEALDQEKNGWNAIGRALQEYSEEASRIGDDIGKALVSAFQSAEEAVGEFVKTGKFDIRELVTSIIADFAKLGARKFIFGPLSDALGGFMSNMGGGWLSAAFNHTGGAAGFGPTRQVHAAAFIGAPRLHNGTPLGLRSDEYAAILQRGERVLNRAQTREWETNRMGGAAPVINFNGVRDVQSFRQSRTQIAADLYRVMGMARRGM